MRLIITLTVLSVELLGKRLLFANDSFLPEHGILVQVSLSVHQLWRFVNDAWRFRIFLLGSLFFLFLLFLHQAPHFLHLLLLFLLGRLVWSLLRLLGCCLWCFDRLSWLLRFLLGEVGVLLLLDFAELLVLCSARGLLFRLLQALARGLRSRHFVLLLLFAALQRLVGRGVRLARLALGLRGRLLVPVALCLTHCRLICSDWFVSLLC